MDPALIRPLFDALETLESVKDIRQITARMGAA